MTRLLAILSLLLPTLAVAQISTNIAWTHRTPDWSVPRDITITPQLAYGIFSNGTAVAINTVSNTAVRVLNIYGALVYAGGTPYTNTFAAGHYFVESRTDRNQFWVTPAGFGPQSMIGTHDTGSWPIGDQMKSRIFPTWERTGFGTWYAVNGTTNSAAYDWTRQDHAYAVMTNYPARKVVYLGADWVPKWIPKLTNTSYASYTNALVQGYTNFLEQALSRYAGKIYSLDVWNEPGGATFGITKNSQVYPLYLTIAKAAKVIADAHGVPMQGPSWAGLRGGGSTFDAVLLSNGFARVVNRYDFHDYNAGEYAPDYDYTKGMIGHPDCLKLPTRIFQNFGGPTCTNKEIFVGEYGVPGVSALGCPAPVPGDDFYTTIPWHRGVFRAIKSVVLLKAAHAVGVVNHLMGTASQYPYHNWAINGFEYADGSQDFRPRGPHPKTDAFLLTCNALEGAAFQSLNTNGVLRAASFRLANGGPLVVAWATEGSTTNYAAPYPLASDVFGNRVTCRGVLTEQPLFFRNASQPDP